MKIHYKKTRLGVILIFKPENEAETFQMDKVHDTLKAEGVEAHHQDNELWVGVVSVLKDP